MFSIEQMMCDLLEQPSDYDEDIETEKVRRLFQLVEDATNSYGHATETLNMIIALCRDDDYSGDKIEAIKTLMHKRALEHLGMEVRIQHHEQAI